MKKYVFIVTIFSVFTLTGCSYFKFADKQEDYPGTQEEVRRERSGSIFDGLNFKLFDSRKDKDAVSSSVISINSYLWRASLDALSFMPLSAVQPEAGVIITNWYEDPQAKGSRFKVDILILSHKLSAEAIKLSVFKQVRRAGSWRDTSVNSDLARELEDKILTRARQLKIEAENQ